MTGAMITSCNKDDLIEQQESDKAPEIHLDNETGIYFVKQGAELSLTPRYLHAHNATFLWTVDGKPVAVTPEYTAQWNDIGEYYVSVSINTHVGSATEELKVTVVKPDIPVISLPMKNDAVTIEKGTDYIIRPEISNVETDSFNIEWVVDSRKVSEELQYTFHAEDTGEYHISITASNVDGSSTKKFTIYVVDQLPIGIEFPTPSYFNPSTTRYTFAGRPVYLSPIITGTATPTYSWSLDGSVTDCTSGTYVFTPSTAGEYNIAVTVNNTYTASVKVICTDANESDRYRKATASSRAHSVRVYEWCPAPGQFIGDTHTGGMTGNETTPESANAWAQQRLDDKAYVSLGGWGGYIIVGFDHSIPRREGRYDFSIMGNAFFNADTGDGGSNEPGIVYVMQDVNGNGLPDDEWYELRGSETGHSVTLQNYAVTYYRPSGSGMNVQWTDNYGLQGCIDYLSAFHRQPTYYPEWIPADSYTLRGTRLEARTTQSPDTGHWDCNAFSWGYADNKGSDDMSGDDVSDGSGQSNGFMIENAMYPDLSAINLRYIDFIKVQTGVNSKAGWLGEVSTEIRSFKDLSITQ